MPRDMGDTRIEVNIPDFEAVVIDKGEVIERNRVVVGKEDNPDAGVFQHDEISDRQSRLERAAIDYP